MARIWSKYERVSKAEIPAKICAAKGARTLGRTEPLFLLLLLCCVGWLGRILGRTEPLTRL